MSRNGKKGLRLFSGFFKGSALHVLSATCKIPSFGEELQVVGDEIEIAIDGVRIVNAVNEIKSEKGRLELPSGLCLRIYFELSNYLIHT